MIYIYIYYIYLIENFKVLFCMIYIYIYIYILYICFTMRAPGSHKQHFLITHWRSSQCPEVIIDVFNSSPTHGELITATQNIRS